MAHAASERTGAGNESRGRRRDPGLRSKRLLRGVPAIHLREPGHERLIERIDAAEVVVVGVPTLLETAMVLTTRLGQDARPMLSAFLRRLEAEIVPFNEEHLDAAATAFIRFGRGRHPAALNFGDCMSYAVASVAGMPLLFAGEDFKRTDIAQA